MTSLNNTVIKLTINKDTFVSCCCCCFIFCFLSSTNYMYMYHSTFKTILWIQILQSIIQFNPKNISLDVGFISVSLSPVTTDQTFATASHTFWLDESFSVYIKMGKTKWYNTQTITKLIISLNRYELLYSLIATHSFKRLLFNPAARLETQVVKE